MPVPTERMAAAARKAQKFKAQGKAKTAGTPVGWRRASQLVSKQNLSKDTVKRMYSFFSRHRVDKQAPNFGNDEKPSNGYIMWLAWGGDAGYAWSKSQVERFKREEEKAKKS